MDPLFKELAQNLQGEVKFDIISKTAYSVDASIYEIQPLGIVIPKNTQDILNTIKIASRYGIPLIPRGAATGITGGCLGKGIILDTSKYLHRILEINYQKGYAICEPGVVQDQLNQALSGQGYRLGPDTSTGNRATLGGMLANNAAGARSLRYGKMVDHVQEVELALATGELISFGTVYDIDLPAKLNLSTLEGQIYREVLNIKNQYFKEIERRFPKIDRRVSGYNLDELIKLRPMNISRLIAGSEGTLGIATKIKMNICLKPKATCLCVIHFSDLLNSMYTIDHIMASKPLALEMIDRYIIENAKKAHSLKEKVSWIDGKPACLFIVEYDGENSEEAFQKCVVLKRYLIEQKIGYAHPILRSPTEIAHVWDVRKAGLGLLLSKRTYNRAIAFIEDLSISTKNLPAFMSKFLNYLQSKNKQAGIYGHVGSGCIHVRPYINLRDESEVKLMQQMMLDVSDIIMEFGGSLSGEHGDGLIRSWLNKKMFGDQVYEAFKKLKQVFDPTHLMNPSKIVEGPPPLNDLRNKTEQPISIPTFLDFSSEGGFELSVDLCNGNGSCRKKEGIMCPSFQVSDDEYDTTRARAQALRSIVNGKLPSESISSPEVLNVLDLCLECKGCKTECPSQVDMAKMKSEVLYQYQEKHGYFLRHYLFAHVPKFNKIGSSFPKLFNWIATTKITKYMMDWIGITAQRELPSLADQKFSCWLKKNPQQEKYSKKVVLFNDTFTQFNETSIGISAVKVLNKLGYKVEVPPWSCCGRPQISKGFLKQAKEKAMTLIDILLPYAEDNVCIIGLEPSCILTIKDDLLGLVGSMDVPSAKIKKIASLCKTFDEFISDNAALLASQIKLNSTFPEVLVHIHCHQKALIGSGPTLKVLQAIPGLKVAEIKSGCCGMAGSFGYEKEHYSLSIAIANLKIVPTIQTTSLDTALIANGISCRTQIAHTTGRWAKHLAEFLAEIQNL